MGIAQGLRVEFFQQSALEAEHQAEDTVGDVWQFVGFPEIPAVRTPDGTDLCDLPLHAKNTADITGIQVGLADALAVESKIPSPIDDIHLRSLAEIGRAHI